MRSVVIVTDVKFWRKGAGHRSRIRELVNYICQKVDLKVLFVGEETPKVKGLLVEKIHSYKILFFDGDKKIEHCREFIVNLQPHACIVEYLHLADVISHFPNSITTYIDTHDLLSHRELSFKQLGYHHQNLSEEQEISMLSQFDYIILINQNEYDVVNQYVSKARLILCPHPAIFDKQERPNEVSTVGFIGSEYLPNIDAMRWFTNQVWPHFSTSHITLKIYGNVCNHLDIDSESRNIELVGYVSDINKMYSEIDIVVNPVRMGSGLKIKNIEALSSGLPLITTSHGATGLRLSSERTFLVADDSEQFITALNQLIDNHVLRASLSYAAYNYSYKFYSKESCFEDLITCVLNH